MADVIKAEVGDTPRGGVEIASKSITDAVPMRMHGFDAWVEEVSYSRTLGGVHYRFSNEAGEELGHRAAAAATGQMAPLDPGAKARNHWRWSIPGGPGALPARVTIPQRWVGVRKGESCGRPISTIAPNQCHQRHAPVARSDARKVCRRRCAVTAWPGPTALAPAGSEGHFSSAVDDQNGVSGCVCIGGASRQKLAAVGSAFP